VYYTHQKAEIKNQSISNNQKLKSYMNIIHDYKKYLNNKHSIPYPIYYINMDKNQDRKKFMEKEFSSLTSNSGPITRIKGFDGFKINNLQHDTVDGIEFINNYDDMNKGEIGCTISHLLAIKKAYEEGKDIAIIMEDDLLFDFLSLHQPIKTIVDKAPVNWEIIQLFTYNHTSNENKKEYNFIKRPKNSYYTSTASYIINRNGMEKIINNTYNNNIIVIGSDTIKNSTRPKQGRADHFIYDLLDNCYVLEPSFFITNDIMLKSSIHEDHNQFHIKSTLFKLEKNKTLNILETLFKIDKILKDKHIPFCLVKTENDNLFSDTLYIEIYDKNIISFSSLFKVIFNTIDFSIYSVPDTGIIIIFTYYDKEFNSQNYEQLKIGEHLIYYYKNINTNVIDGEPILWEKSIFVENNWPGLDYEIDEKKKIFEMAKNLPHNKGIIDVGAHIGDLAIQLAKSLTNIGRDDIIVYAIEPSKQKCDFMEKMAFWNRIPNIIILNYGLSDKKGTFNITNQDTVEKNTGAIAYSPNIKSDIEFITADILYKSKILHDIGIYHIDVEGAEIDLINGSKELIKNCQPIMLIEHFIINNKIKCQNREECKDLYRLLDDLNYYVDGYMSNGDMICKPNHK
jgi:FkbM family methyltransferase